MMDKIKLPQTRQVEAAFRKAWESALRRARETGTPVVTWEDGEVRLVPPERWDGVGAGHAPAGPKPPE